jgi:hypothetical protein
LLSGVELSLGLLDRLGPTAALQRIQLRLLSGEGGLRGRDVIGRS